MIPEATNRELEKKPAFVIKGKINVQKIQAGGKKPRNLIGNLFETYGRDLEKNHFKKIGYFEADRPREQQIEPSKVDPIEEHDVDVKAERRVKIVNKPMKNLFHYADYEQLKADAKNQLGRGLGPNVGSEKWNLAKSKQIAMSQFNEELRQFQLYQLRKGIHPKKREESASKTPNLHERVREFVKFIPKPKQNPKAVQLTTKN